MKLYHYTDAENVPSIRAQGLIPRALPRAFDDGHPAGALSNGGQPVVWLTGAADFSGVRLTVRLEANSKRLVHYATWARKHVPQFDAILAALPLHGSVTAATVEQWYIYFGTIPPNRIEQITDVRQAA
jgi:hypothetical protein